MNIERKGGVMKRIINCLDFICVWPLLILRLLKYGYSFRKIYLGEDEWALVEPSDYYRLKNFKWYLNGNGKEFYAFANIKAGPGKTRMVSMHRQLMDPPPHLLVDHRNGHTLDNRRSNLRLATQSQNMQNRAKKLNVSSKFIGVCFDKKRGKWKAQIKTGGENIFLGRFSSETDAARAYDRAAREYHKDFARLNFPNEQSTLLSTND
jgi:frataxin-like iron-binding protein CyaY